MNVKQKIHKLKVDREKLLPDVLDIGTQGTIGFDAISPAFSSDWDGLEIKAVFHPVRGKPVEVIYTGEEVEIPPEVMKYIGDAGVMFTGFKVTEDGRFPVLNSDPCHLHVRHTYGNEGGNSIPQTPSAYEQLIASMRKDVEQSVENALTEAKESGEFDGPPGIGLPGPVGPSGVYMLKEGETMEDVPPEYNVALDPWNPKEVTIFDRGILAILRTSGDGSPGSLDTYTIYYSDNTSTEYTVYNGANGKGFVILGYFDTYDDLVSSVTKPETGDSYGVGTEPPYDIFVYDGVNKVWRNNGSLTGVQGEPGKSVEMQVSGGYIRWRQEGGNWTELIALSELEGKGILTIERTDGNGSAGTIDTYTITFTDGSTMKYQVTNGNSVTVSDKVTSDGKDAVSGSAVAAYVEEMIYGFLNGAS